MVIDFNDHTLVQTPAKKVVSPEKANTYKKSFTKCQINKKLSNIHWKWKTSRNLKAPCFQKFSPYRATEGA